MSTHYLALDIGSTTVVAIVINLDPNAVVGTASATNPHHTYFGYKPTISFPAASTA